MPDDKTKIIEQASAWLPENIISLISELAWPLVVLILGLRFKSSISSAVKNFFTKNEVTEVSAGASGVTAKFKAAQQAAEVKDEGASVDTILPSGMDYESLVEKHAQLETDFSNKLYENIITHTNALGIDDTQKVDLLSKELSLLKVLNIFNIINKIIFRSQFDLFNYMPQDGGVMPQDDIQKYYDGLPSKSTLEHDGWDLFKYLAYPASSGLIEYEANGYKLTNLGIAYVKFMRSNISLIDELSKI